MLLKLVYDELTEEERAELQEKLDKYRDPEVRKGQEALSREERRTAEEKTARERGQSEAVGDFWRQTDAAIKGDLGEFEYLEAEDATEIKSEFHRGFNDRFKELAAAYVQHAPKVGATKEEALAEAERDAAEEMLTNEALRTVMKGLDSKYAKRATKVRGKDERKGTSEAEKHNRRVEGKREQSRDGRNRSLRGGGAAPSAREPGRKGKEPVGFEAKMERAFGRLRAKMDSDDED